MNSQAGYVLVKCAKHWLTSLALVVPLSLLVAVVFLGAPQAQAASDPGETYYQSLIQDVEDGEKAPIEYQKDLYGDPYGYGKNVPFYMAGQNELAVFQSYGGGSGDRTQFKSYDGLTTKDWNSKDLLADKNVNHTYSVPSGNDELALNYVQMTAFDPTGIGRDDHIALIGVHYTSETDKGLYLIVYDADGHNSGYQKVGQVNWMAHELFNAMNCLSITAGDYDNDKKDSLVIYGAFDNEGIGLYEYAVTSTGANVSVAKKNSTASSALLNPDASLKTTNGQPCHTLNAQVETGDVNGDKIDDLVVVSYKCDRSGQSGTVHPAENEMYPYVAVKLGGDNLDNVATSKDMGMLVRSATGTANQYESAHMPGLSVGDINGDKRDEVVLGGIYYKYSSSTEAFEGDKGKMGVATLAVSDGGLTLNSFNSVAANGYTNDGFYWDNCDPQTVVQCVAFDGPGNPEQIFMNGFVYTYANGQVSQASVDGETANVKYFNEADNYLGAGTNQGKLSNTFFWTAAAGNFTGTNSSREQLVFVTCLKTSGHENYHFVIGMIEGKNTNNSNLVNYYQYSDYGILDGHIVPAYMVDADAELNRNKALNFAICAVDNDNDGVIVRYTEKGYTYSDPEVLAVIQSAPFFDEVPYATDTSNTTYAISETRSFESGSSASTSAGVAIVASTETDVCDIEMEAGYSHEWSEEFTQGVSTENEYNWSACGKDQVVVYRTPVMLYTYEVMLPDGTWPDTAEERESNALTVTVPCTSTYSLMTIDDYNAFVRVFNSHMQERAKALRQEGQSISSSDIPKLEILKDPYIHHEGNPLGFRKAIDTPTSMILQGTAQEFTVGESSTGFSFNKSTNTSHSASTTHGFSFEMSVSFGFELFGNGSKAGIKASLGYTEGHSTTETTENSERCNCTVFNMLARDIVDAGIDLDFVKRYYSFKYQMAMWDSNLASDNPNGAGKVPIVGYALSNVSKPDDPRLNGQNTLTVEEGYEAQTVGGYSLSSNPTPTVAKRSGSDKISYDAATKTIRIAEGLAPGKHVASFTVCNGNPNVDTVFNFQLTVLKKEEAVVYDLADEIRNLPYGNLAQAYRDEWLVKDFKAAKEKYDALSEEDKAKLSAADLQKLNTIGIVVDAIEEFDAISKDGGMSKLEGILTNEAWRSDFEECARYLIDENETNYDENPSAYEEAWDQFAGMVQDLYLAYEQYRGLSYPQVKLLSDAYNDADVPRTFADFFNLAGNAQLRYSQHTDEPMQQDWEAFDQAVAQYSKFRDDVRDLQTESPEAASAYEELCEQGLALRETWSELDGWTKGEVADSLFRSEQWLGEKYFLILEMAAKSADAVSAVEKLLKGLPDTEYVQLEDEASIGEYQAAYDALTDEQKALIRQDLVKNLEAAEEALAELKADPLDIDDANVSIPSQTYTGHPVTPVPEVTYDGKDKPLVLGVDFQLRYSNNVEVGIATVKLVGIGKYTGSKMVFFEIKASEPAPKPDPQPSVKAKNPLNIKGKMATVKFVKLKKKAQTLAVSKVIRFTKKGVGKVTYKLSSVKRAKFKKFFKVNAKTGKITVKRGLKKGTYQVKIAVSAAGNANYEKTTKPVTCKIRVK